MRKYYQNNAKQRLKKGKLANKSHKKNMPIYSLVQTHKRNGNIVKEPCIICGNVNVHGHHKNYDKPLELTWLCPRHHKEVHSGILKA